MPKDASYFFLFIPQQKKEKPEIVDNGWTSDGWIDST